VKRVGCFEYLNVARDYDWALGLVCRVDDDFNNGVYMMFCVMRGSIMARLEGTGWGVRRRGYRRKGIVHTSIHPRCGGRDERKGWKDWNERAL